MRFFYIIFTVLIILISSLANVHANTSSNILSTTTPISEDGNFTLKVTVPSGAPFAYNLYENGISKGGRNYSPDPWIRLSNKEIGTYNYYVEVFLTTGVKITTNTVTVEVPDPYTQANILSTSTPISANGNFTLKVSIPSGAPFAFNLYENGISKGGRGYSPNPGIILSNKDIGTYNYYIEASLADGTLLRSNIVTVKVPDCTSYNIELPNDFNKNAYTVYRGDLDNNNSKNDYLFVGKEQIIMIHGDIIIPIVISAPRSFKLIEQSDGSYTYQNSDKICDGIVYNTENIDSLIITKTIEKVPSNEIHTANFNNDGQTDLLIYSDNTLNVIHWDKSTPSLVSQVNFPSTYRMELKDVNNDNRDDILFFDGYELIWQLLADSDGEYSEATKQDGIQAANTPGHLAYTSKVNYKGRSTINIPLKMAPGVNGLAPDLSISYQSTDATDAYKHLTSQKVAHRQEDIIGNEWKLTGLSEIAYCGIDLDSGPAYCLDGEPLDFIRTNHFEGGVDEEFIVWNNPLVKVIKHHPGGFRQDRKYTWVEVFLPDGSIVEYGRTEDSRHNDGAQIDNKIDYGHYWRSLSEGTHTVTIPLKYNGSGTQPAETFTKRVERSDYIRGDRDDTAYSQTKERFRINKKTDAFGNTMTFDYHNDNLYGYTYPLRISYGNKNTTGHDSHIYFEYEPRTQSELTSGLASITQEDIDYFTVLQAVYPVRLTKLRIEQNGKIIRDYRLKTSLSDGWERFHQLQQCGHDDNSQFISCIQPLTFSWDKTPPKDSYIPRLSQIPANVTGINNGQDNTQFEYTMLMGDSLVNTLSTGSPITWPWPTDRSVQGAASSIEVYTGGHLNTLVTAKTVSNGIGNSNRFEYAYQGKGYSSSTWKGAFAGFSTTLEWDVSNNIYSYSQHSKNVRWLGVLANNIKTHGLWGQVEAEIISKKHVEMWFRWAYDDDAAVRLTLVTIPYTKAITDYLYEDGQLLGVKNTEYSFIVDSNSCNSSAIDSDEYCKLSESIETVRWADDAQLTEPDYHTYKNDGFNKPVNLVNITRSIKTIKKYQNDITNNQRLLRFNNSTTISYFDGDTDTPAVTSRLYGATPYVHQGKKTNKLASKRQFTNNPNNPLWLVTSYQYSDSGNMVSASDANYYQELRSTSYSNYLDNRYPTTVKNALNQSTSLTYDKRFGLVTTNTDANQQVTSHRYDAFGRLLSTNTSETSTNKQYEACFAVACPTIGSVAAVTRITTTSDFTKSVLYLDSLDRTIRQVTQGFDGTNIHQDTWYNNQGQMWKKSLPYEANSTAQYSVYNYDLRGRISTITHADNTSTSYKYSVDSSLRHIIVTETKTVKDSTGQLDSSLTKVSSRRSHYTGDLVKITEAKGSSKEVQTEFSYYPTGLLKTSTLDGNLMASLSYDSAGNRIELEDASVGTVVSHYTPYNQLAWQITNSLTTDERRVDYHYDLLGRVKTATTADGVQTTVYDPTNAIGAIDYVEFVDTDNEYYHMQEYSYNSASRVINTNTVIDVPNLTRSYSQSITYDGFGRIDTVTDLNNEVVSQYYNQWGYATELTGSNAEILHQITAMNAFGSITNENFANGLTTEKLYHNTSNLLTSITTSENTQQLNYQWSSNGLLESREDVLANQFESFDYDKLYRLENSYVDQDGTQIQHQQQEYDLLGNIESKQTLVGDGDSVSRYIYGDLNRSERNAGLNAVKSATINGVEYQLYYNVHGEINQYQPSSGTATIIDWNDRGKPHQISKGSDVESFAYGINGARYYRQSQWQDSNGISHTEHTFYAPGLEEVVTGDDNVYQRLEKVSVASDVLKIYAYNYNGDVEQHYEYMHRDHLGSVDKITDGAGNILVTASFNSFGQRRGLDWNGTLSGQDYKNLLKESGVHVSLGYTGHEMLDMVGLIHMNGRVYDPILGRFLSPDPFIQAPELSQSYNRYSYVMNNPLSLTDPTGYMWFTDGWVQGAFWETFAKIWEPTPKGNLGLASCDTCQLKIVEPGDNLSMNHNGVAQQAVCHMGCHGVDYSEHRQATEGELLPLTVMTMVVDLATPIPPLFTMAKAGKLADAGQLGTKAFESLKALPPPSFISNAGGKVVSDVTKKNEIFYRVFSGENTMGAFLTKIPPKSSAFAREGLALPSQNTANFIQQVMIPSGTRLLRSRTTPVPQWGRFRGGVEQFQLLDRIPMKNFGKGVPFK